VSATFAGLVLCAAFACLVALATPTPARAQLQNENLLVTMPQGFKLAYRAKRDNVTMTEMIPQGENLQNWTEMLTVHIFLGQRALTPAAFRARIEAGWKQACAGSGTQTLSENKENGYPALTFRLTCARNPTTGKPENTWFKAMAGGNSFYVVQKAMRVPAEQAREADQIALLGRVSICDTRRPDRACPAGMK
jgi:hypothetical protein